MSRRRKIPAQLQALYNQLEPYQRVLKYADIAWMDGLEIGMAPASGRAKRKYPILLWPYLYKNVDEMASVLTHEIVHYAHPDLESNEPAIEAKTQGLMKNPIWEMLVMYKLLHTVHVALKDKFRENPKFTLG